LVHLARFSRLAGKERFVNPSKLWLFGFSVCLACGTFASAQEKDSADGAAGSAAPAAAKQDAATAGVDTDSRPAAARRQGQGAAAAQRRPARLTQPWNKLTTLSEDQKNQIRAIHRKAIDEIQVIEKRERADVMALLNEAQKAELQKITEEEAVARKTRAAANRPGARSGGRAPAGAASNGASGSGGASGGAGADDKGAE